MAQARWEMPVFHRRLQRKTEIPEIPEIISLHPGRHCSIMKQKKSTHPSLSSTATSPEEASSKPSFESAVTELENIVRQLECDDLTLDSALSNFERGVALMRVCDSHLNHARGRITELFKGENGAFIEKILGMSLESFLNEDDDHE